MKSSFSFRIFDVILCAALVSMLFIVSGCCTQRRAVEDTTIIIDNDSANTEVRVETRIEYVTDTLIVEIPPQSAERTTADSTSHLENDYAESDARINPDGTLYHDLRTKPQDKKVEFQKPVERKDSVRTEYKIKYKTRYKKQIVEKEKSWWERTCIKWFPWSIGVIILLIGYIFRKPLLKLIKIAFV